MSGPGLLAPAIIVLLALAALAGIARLAWNSWRAPTGTRPHAWRVTALVVLQAAAALLLYFALLPPERAVPGGTLVVLTPGADAGQAPAGEHVVALPGVAPRAGLERVPDLGTALRRYPATTRLRIAGAGLPARDLPAASRLPIQFEPPPLPAGIVELWTPARVSAAGDFAVHGRVHGVRAGTVELLDPSARRVDQATIADDGSFALRGVTTAPGEVAFRVRVRDARRNQVEIASVPLLVAPPPSRAMLLMSGAPNPEARFLQRWALEAGMTVHAQASLGAGVRIGDPPVAFDAASLGRFDIAVLDERAWQDLGAPAHAALREAVANGLGLVIRVTGPLSANGRARLRDLGLTLEEASLPGAVRLDAGALADAEADANAGDGNEEADEPAAPAVLPLLSRRPLRARADDGIAVLRDAGGEALAVARNHGRGRVAAWLVTDTWRLVLAGHGTRHARLWSDALAAVARPGAPAGPRVAGDARAGARVALCGVAAGSTVRAPDGTTTPLHLDPSVPGPCAAFWPRLSGWHRVGTDDASTAFHVDAADALPAARLLALRERTLAVAAGRGDTAARAAASAPGSRWPWSLGLLAVLALLWWLERAPAGRR